MTMTNRRGRRSRVLRPDQIKRLENYRIARRLSIYALNAAMGGRENFTWEVLDRALKGKPVAELNHRFIVEWIERHVSPEPETKPDGKTAACGRESDESSIPQHEGTGRRESAGDAGELDGSPTRRGSNQSG